MTQEFSYTELSIVRNMMLSRSHKDIALLLDRGTDEIGALIGDLTSGRDIITHQHKLDSKKAAAKVLAKKTAPVKVKAGRPVNVISAAAAEKQQRDKRKEERRANTMERVNVEAKRKAEKLHEKRSYKTKQVDYSNMVLIRIDKSTQIYSEPGKEAATRAEFMKHYVRPIDRDFNPPKK